MKRDKIIRIASCCLAAVALTVTAVGLTGSRVERDNLKCKDVEIQILDSASNMFATREHIERILNNEFGGYRNRLADSVNLHRLESVLMRHKYIEECCAYFTPDGMLHVTVRQCTPVIKLESDSTRCYLDRKGECLPVIKDWSTGLLSVKGSPRITDSRWTARVAAMATWIDSREEWRDAVVKATSSPDGEITLRLEGRNERFIVGQPVRIREKFRRMGIYLEKIAADSTCKEYRAVNVKYHGQIICK